MTGILLLVWAASRVFLLVMELVCGRIGFVESNPTNWISLAVLLLFAWGIWKGSGALAWLPMLGGVFMLILAFRQDLFSLLGIDLDPVFRLYLIAYFSAIVIQLAAMALILALPSCRRYAKTSMSVMRELNGQPKEEHRL